MIFKPEHCELILQGKKTMTRRLVKDGEYAPLVYNDEVLGVFFSNGRTKWKLYGDYSIQPGRTAKGIGRIRITDIRRERMQSINVHDIRAEGITLDLDETNDWNHLMLLYFQAWRDLWNSINKKKGTRWEDNPEVWVLSFELCEVM